MACVAAWYNFDSVGATDAADPVVECNGECDTNLVKSCGAAEMPLDFCHCSGSVDA